MAVTGAGTTGSGTTAGGLFEEVKVLVTKLEGQVIGYVSSGLFVLHHDLTKYETIISLAVGSLGGYIINRLKALLAKA